jgi:hypothetical protein
MNRLIAALSLASLACGYSAAIPTAAPTVRVTAYAEPTAPPVIFTEREHGQLVRTLGKLNVRACPSTSCAVLYVLDMGAAVYVDDAVQGDGCQLWYPLADNEGFICKDWTSVD